MRLLFDHNVPRKLRNFLPGHEVKTALEMGWAGLENWELLKAAEAENFDVMLTCDQSISYQQNLAGLQLALVALDTNYWPTLRENTAPVVQAVNAARPGSFQTVSIGPRRPRTRNRISPDPFEKGS